MCMTKILLISNDVKEKQRVTREDMEITFLPLSIHYIRQLHGFRFDYIYIEIPDHLEGIEKTRAIEFVLKINAYYKNIEIHNYKVLGRDCDANI